MAFEGGSTSKIGFSMAIFIVVVGLAFYFADPLDDGGRATKTAFAQPLPSIGDAWVTVNGTIIVPLYNNRSSPITITQTVFGNYDCKNISFVEGVRDDGRKITRSTPIINGSKFNLTFRCLQKDFDDKYAADITFEYFIVDFGISMKHSGVVRSYVSN